MHAEVKNRKFRNKKGKKERQKRGMRGQAKVASATLSADARQHFVLAFFAIAF